jgi:hypothetical protein
MEHRPLAGLLLEFWLLVRCALAFGLASLNANSQQPTANSQQPTANSQKNVTISPINPYNDNNLTSNLHM